MGLDAGSVIGGKYRLFKPLARGGMGAIWVARHTELDVAVAIKVIASDMVLSQTALSRFRHEARAAAQLRSPHVVQILDYGIEEGVPFMAMELLTGDDLGQRIAAKGRLPLGNVVEILAPVCKALKLAHDARIVHRDLKPGNIFLAQVGDDEIVKVLDFGIAKALTPEGGLSQTASTTLVGSPLYMSPEQSRGDPVDGRSDLWSLSVLAYEALTGAPPFEGRGLGDLFGQICHGAVPLISTRGVTAPGLDAFFARALAKEPADRFATSGDWIEAFKACQTGALLARVSSPASETQDIELAAAAPLTSGPQIRAEVAARTGGSGTNAGISSEVRKEVSASIPPPPRRAIWPWALLASGLLGGLAGWAALSFRPGLVGDSTATAGALASGSESPGAVPEPDIIPGDGAGGKASGVMASSEAGSPSPEASASTARSGKPVVVVAVPAVKAGTRPGGIKPVATGKPTAKPIATTDDIFGIPKDK